MAAEDVEDQSSAGFPVAGVRAPTAIKGQVG